MVILESQFAAVNKQKLADIFVTIFTLNIAQALDFLVISQQASLVSDLFPRCCVVCRSHIIYFPVPVLVSYENQAQQYEDSVLYEATSKQIYLCVIYGP